MKLTTLRVVPAAAAAVALGLGLSGCGAANEAPASAAQTTGAKALRGTLNGAGSSAQEAAQGAWTAAFQSSNPGVTVNYDPSGSGAGVEEFLAGAVAFAGSDAYLSTDQVASSKKTCHGSTAIEVPAYISPIALVYHVNGLHGLRLTPDTVAKIFVGKITSWNDPAIKATNPKTSLPSTRIAPVHRSDDSGTTNNFTDYLHQTAGSVWTYPAAETWPIKSGEGANGTSGVVAAVQSGNGTIGYADASQAGSLDVAAVKVGSAYIGPEPAAAAKVADLSTQVSGRSVDDLAINVNRTTSAGGAYPLVLISYVIACPSDPDKASAGLVRSYLTYAVGKVGQADAAKAAGSAPLSSQLSGKDAKALSTISGKG